MSRDWRGIPCLIGDSCLLIEPKPPEGVTEAVDSHSVNHDVQSPEVQGFSHPESVGIL